MTQLGRLPKHGQLEPVCKALCLLARIGTTAITGTFVDETFTDACHFLS